MRRRESGCRHWRECSVTRRAQGFRLITHHQADIDRVNSRQMTPLLLAVKNGMWSCVEYLLDHQAAIEHCDKQKRTCLIIAASEGHLAVIDSLLEKGLNLN